MAISAELNGKYDVDVPWCVTDAHASWRATIREFCRTEVEPGAAKRDETGSFDEALVRALGDLGVMGLLVPSEYGGSGGDLLSLCIAIEELARVDSSLAVTAHVQAISVTLFAELATEDDKQRLLPAMCSGESFISFGLTEPSSGSDAQDIATRAERDGDEWLLNGAKQFITNAGTPMSRHVIVFAATGPGRPGRPQVSAFLVPTDAPGFELGARYPKMGWRSSDTRPLFFTDVRLPAAALLGDEGRAFSQAMQFLEWARVPIAAMSTGLAQGCLDETLKFVNSRSSFQKPLSGHQAVAFSVADIAAMTATARVLTYDAAWKFDAGQPIGKEAAIAKLMASELANRAAYVATQLHGGYGFMDDSAVARHYRDARILTVGEGTSEVQRMVIARHLDLPV